MPKRQPEYIYGLHEPGGEQHMADRPGSIVHLAALSQERSGDYRAWDRFFNIVRLGWGYDGAGTIPTRDLYAEMAGRCASFVGNSPGVDAVIIGNEPNHAFERPNGEVIRTVDYIRCYTLCYAAIKAVRPDVQVYIAAVAPWNLESGDWLHYWREIVNALWQMCDGFAVHAYTHGTDPSLVTSDQEVNGWPWHFRVYISFLDAIPAAARHLPVYITETNQDEAWLDSNSGWVQAAYAEVQRWNSLPGKSKIMSLVLYRWPKEKDGSDRWWIDGKNGVIADFRAVVAHGYRAPHLAAQADDDETKELLMPTIFNKPSSASSLPPRDIDPRAALNGVKIEPAPVGPGRSFWRVVKVQWFDEQESQGRHHIYVEALDEQGNLLPDMAFEVLGPGAPEILKTKGGQGFDAGNFPMWANGNVYAVRMANGASDAVTGIGMGADTPEGFNRGIHTSTLVTFQLTTMPNAEQPDPIPEPTTPAPTPRFRVSDGVQTAYHVNVRRTAGYLNKPENDVLDVLAPGTRFVLAEGPQIVDGLVWWRIPDGWVAESNPSGMTLLVEQMDEPDKPTTPAPIQPQPAPAQAGVIDPLVLEAIILTESNGAAFQKGRLVIRLEAHLLLGPTWGNPDRFQGYFRYEADYLKAYFRRSESEAWVMYHGNQELEWQAFDFARTLDAAATLRCASYGAGQIMGFNAKRVGYSSPLAMFEAFRRTEIPQLVAVVNYCLSDPKLMLAIQAKDWGEIVRRYNGEGLESVYGPRLLANYRKVGGQ